MPIEAVFLKEKKVKCRVFEEASKRREVKEGDWEENGHSSNQKEEDEKYREDEWENYYNEVYDDEKPENGEGLGGYKLKKEETSSLRMDDAVRRREKIKKEPEKYKRKLRNNDEMQKITHKRVTHELSKAILTEIDNGTFEILPSVV